MPVVELKIDGEVFFSDSVNEDAVLKHKLISKEMKERKLRKWRDIKGTFARRVNLIKPKFKSSSLRDRADNFRFDLHEYFRK